VLLPDILYKCPLLPGQERHSKNWGISQKRGRRRRLEEEEEEVHDESREAELRRPSM
jgi:hypothetical protein